MRYLFDPVCEWVDAQDVHPIVLANTSASPPVDRSATIVDTLLVNVQGILSQCDAAQKTPQEDEDDDDESEHSGEEDGEDAPKDRPALPQTDVGTTLFIRNVPYDATEDDLRTLCVFLLYFSLRKP